MAISDMTRKNKIIFGEDHQDPSYGEREDPKCSCHSAKSVAQPSLTVYSGGAYTINGSMTKKEAIDLLNHLKRISKEIELGRAPFDFIR